jgi:uncharacterized protein YbjQ (UPF0145 family)
MRCQGCDRDNPSGSGFCGFCGRPMLEPLKSTVAARPGNISVAAHTRQVQCPGCLLISDAPDLGASHWDCPCGFSYELRRCSACRIVSHVSTTQRRGEPWNCTWCQASNTGYTSRNDPATATIADLANDMARRGLEFEGKREKEQVEERDAQPVLIVTTNDIPGCQIKQVHGDVFGLIVRARNYFSNLGAQFRTLAGGEVAGYTKLLTDSRNQARERMWREARARGANAVVGMRFDCNEIGDIMSEVVAYGTAVTVEPVIAAETGISAGVSPRAINQ